MRLYEFKNVDGTIDVTVTTDGCGNQKRVFITTTPTGKGYAKAGPTGTDPSIQALGFPFVAGTEVDHNDFISFAEKAGLQLLQWNEGLGEPSIELVTKDGSFVYTLTVTSPVNFVKAGETKALVIVSKKQKTVNGIPEGALIDVATTVTATGTGFTVSGKSIVAAANAGTTANNGTATVTQTEGGKKVVVSLIQAGV